jgi:hypothetical protein
MSFVPRGVQPTNNNSSPTTVKEAIVMVSMLGALVLAAVPLLSGLGTLLSAVSQDLPHAAVSMIVLSGFAGVFAGVAGAVFKSVRFKVDPMAKSFVSAYFNKSLVDIRIDGAFWGRIVVGGMVGWMVGAWLAAAGFTSVPELVSGVYTLSNLIPMHSGGFGGSPPPASLFGILFLLLLAILVGPVAGLISGSLVSIGLSMIAGVTKGTVKAYVEDVLSEPSDRSASAIMIGAFRGLAVGMVAGIIQAICSALAVFRFAA